MLMLFVPNILYQSSTVYDSSNNKPVGYAEEQLVCEIRVTNKENVVEDFADYCSEAAGFRADEKIWMERSLQKTEAYEKVIT